MYWEVGQIYCLRGIEGKQEHSALHLISLFAVKHHLISRGATISKGNMAKHAAELGKGRPLWGTLEWRDLQGLEGDYAVRTFCQPL